nr:hypothetical protein [Tanacetum cinerariifolium]
MNKRQTATGKEISNPFMAGVNTPRCNEDRLELMELMVFLLPSDEKVRVEFWTSVAVKKVNDVTRLQALVDKKKVIITEASIRDALRLDDAKGVECLPNEEIFTELARVGYEKPSTKLTFLQGIFLKPVEVSDSHHTVDEGDAEVNVDDVSTAGVAVEGDVSAANYQVPTADDEPSIPSPTPPTPPPQPLQDVAQALEITKLKSRVKKLERRNKASKLKRLKRVGTAQRIDTSNDTVMDDVSKQGRMIADIDADVDVVLKDDKEFIVEKSADVDESADVQGRKAESQAQIYHIDLEHANKVLNMQDDEGEPAKLQEVVETKEQMDEEDSRALKMLNESQEDKAAKKQKLDEEVEELKRHLQIVLNDEDDVYTKATPLARKVASEGQELEAVRVHWCADYHIYNNTVDFAGREEISTHKQFEKLVNTSRAKKLERSHDPLALVAHTGSSSRNTSSYYVTHPTSVVDYDDEYQQDDIQTNFKDPLTSAMLLLARDITQNFSNPTNNRLRTSSNTRNQAIIQGDRKYFMEQMLLAKQDEAGVILTDEQNDFLFANASRMEEIEDLSANICLMARIQPTNHSSDVGPSYDSSFVSEVQSSSINENEEQMYPINIKIINSTIGDDQIDNNIIFDTPTGNVNSGSIKKDTHVPDLYALEQLARNAYHEAEKQQIFAQKVQKQNTTLTSQLELYKERVWVLENINRDNNYLNEFLEAYQRAKHFDQQAQSQFILKIWFGALESLYTPANNEDTLDDASKSQQKVKEKKNDPIAIANKQNCWTVDYQQINALYKDCIPLKELSAKQKYFPSSIIPSDKTSNATASISASMPSESPLIIELDKMRSCFQKLSELIQKNCKRESIIYTSPEEIQLNDFCQDQVKPIVN